MAQLIRLWKVDDGLLSEVPLDAPETEAKLEDWLSTDISIIDDDLLVVGRQIRTGFGGVIDLLCMDSEGDLVILELKRSRTPREITAQALDYASWVVDIDHEQVTDLADEYLKSQGGLEPAFRERFDSNLPDTINNSHRIVIIGSQIDSSTERIVQYLSEHHGVNINVVTFQFFKDMEGGEFIARSFLLQPEEVEYKSQSRGTSKRRPKLTLEQLQQIAEGKGVGGIYREALGQLRLFFDRPRRRRTWLSLGGRLDDKWGVMLNLIPSESSDVEGLAFQAYTLRLSKRFGLAEDTLRQALPEIIEDWEYYRDAPPEWSGVQGYFPDMDSVSRFASLLGRGNAV